ncbi:MAG: DUF1622 domain-containing protein [bacterium]|nr:DUF1622 domain-containing protein [bacterium]
MFNKILLYASSAIGIFAVIIIMLGATVTFFRFLKLEILRMAKKSSVMNERELLRHAFGTYLLLGLEFLIAADIIRTIVDFSFKDLGILAGIVLIRTIISVFLNRELK